MAIARFENIAVNNLTFGISAFGEQSTTQTKWFDTRARVSSVANSLKIADKYRLYQDLINFTLNYTPNTKLMVDQQNLYSITWRGNDWRIDNIREADDRMSVLILCYRSDPVTAV
jgi:hypothetical protein|tara:strand:+ start:1791 stop:2135 length:345 start_codon:yes stop_codon:yes gene_type:complete